MEEKEEENAQKTRNKITNNMIKEADDSDTDKSENK
jgi:hypothetical protein